MRKSDDTCARRRDKRIAPQNPRRSVLRVFYGCVLVAIPQRRRALTGESENAAAEPENASPKCTRSRSLDGCNFLVLVTFANRTKE